MFDSIKKWLFQRLALNYMTSGKTDMAAKWYRRYEKLEPDSIAVIHNLGVLYIALKRYDDAERYILRGIELFGPSEIRLRILGDLYYCSGKRIKALAAYRESLAILKQNSGNLSAARFLKRRIKMCSDKDAYSNVLLGIKLHEEGNTSSRKGNYVKALELYSEAVKCDSSNFTALNEAGAIMMNRFMDYNNARKMFMKALELAEVPVIRSNLALAENMIKESNAEQ